MNIVLAANQEFVFATRVCIASILKHNSGVDIYLLYSSINEQDINEMGELIKNLDSSSHFHPTYIDDSVFDGMPTSDVITKETYFRLLILKFLPEADRALYLDTDTIIRKPLDRLYNLTLGNNYAAAVEDWGLNTRPKIRDEVFHKLGFYKHDIYFNAGVWLFNLTQIKKDFNQDALINFLRDNVDIITFHDQDVLNSCFHSRILPVDSVYNCRSYLFSKSDEEFILHNAYVIHYGQKPWNQLFTDICGDAFWEVAISIGYTEQYKEYKQRRRKNMCKFYYKKIRHWVKISILKRK